MTVDPKAPFEAGDYLAQLYYIDHVSKSGHKITKLFLNKCNLVNITESDKFYKLLYSKKIVLKYHLHGPIVGLHKDWMVDDPFPKLFEESEEKEGASLISIKNGKRYHKIQATSRQIKRLSNPEYNDLSLYFESRQDCIPEIEPGYIHPTEAERKGRAQPQVKREEYCPCQKDKSFCVIL